MIETYGTIRPSIEAERSVIGAILVNPDEVMPEAEQMLDPGDFTIPEYRTLFRTFSGYFVDGKPIDVVTVLAQYGEEYKPVLVECAESVPSIRNWRVYARIVIDAAKRRRAWERVEALADALTAGEPVKDCQQLAVRACEELSTTTSGDTVSAREGFLKFYSSMQRPVDYIRTGFSGLDRHTYICRGDFVVIGARPSVGKTALTLQMMLHMARSRKVAYFSLETRNNNLFGRMSANLGGINLREIKTQSGLDFARLAQVRTEFEKLDFHTVEAAGWSVSEIKAKAIQLGAEVIFIDYLQLVRSEGKSILERVSNISMDLHTVAQQSNIAVIALSQLNREGKGKPGMDHLRESGQIEQDADMILLLHAPDGLDPKEGNDASLRDVIIAKNKEGQTGAVALAFNGSTQRFAEIVRYRSESCAK